jgi:hypothetical protein
MKAPLRVERRVEKRCALLRRVEDVRAVPRVCPLVEM